MLTAVGRYWHTLKWLKPVQFYNRVWRTLYRPRPDTRPPPSSRRPSVLWRNCARRASTFGPEDWHRTDIPRLHQYNAHYFDDLVADGADGRADQHQTLITRWIEENPPGQGTGWEPYPSSLRIVNWIKWLAAGNEPVSAMEHSLAVQVRWLRARLEYHLLGNHLWANAKALLFAGAWFDGQEGAQWMDKGLTILRRELDEQILPDGGHFERSPMYHSIVLEDVLDLIQLAACCPGKIPESDVANLHARVPTMMHWLRVMTGPDGTLALFNDTAFGIAPELTALQAYADGTGNRIDARPLQSVEQLDESGFIRIERGRAVLIADVGNVGPDYLPGHAHAGTLSFELWLDGARVLANSGTSTYEPGPERLRQRGTAAHNTVVVSGEDSSEVWSAFRVARRARVTDLRCEDDGMTIRLEATHDGYRRLGGGVIHRRRWRLSADSLEIEDSIKGRYTSAVAMFRFAQGAKPKWRVTNAKARVDQSTWHPCFGQSVPCQVLYVTGATSDWKTEFEFR